MNDLLKNFRRKITDSIKQYPHLEQEMIDVYDFCLSQSEDSSTDIQKQIFIAETDLELLIENNREQEQEPTQWETLYERDL